MLKGTHTTLLAAALLDAHLWPVIKQTHEAASVGSGKEGGGWEVPQQDSKAPSCL